MLERARWLVSSRVVRGRHAFTHLPLTVSVPLSDTRANRLNVLSAVARASELARPRGVRVGRRISLYGRCRFRMLFERHTDRLRAWVHSRIGMMLP